MAGGAGTSDAHPPVLDQLAHQLHEARLAVVDGNHGPKAMAGNNEAQLLFHKEFLDCCGSGRIEAAIGGKLQSEQQPMERGP
jgi:hypothetical protein